MIFMDYREILLRKLAMLLVWLIIITVGIEILKVTGAIGVFGILFNALLSSKHWAMLLSTIIGSLIGVGIAAAMDR